MQGEFRGDFTRNTYDKSKHFLRVLMQQGRVQLDADWNEQISILLERLQTLAQDIIGLHGGSEDNYGFEFIATQEQINNLSGLSNEKKTQLTNRLQYEGYLIGKGNYYVEGVLCENEDYIPFAKQPDFTPELRLDTCEIQVDGGTYLAYLDVWERHITHIEDDDRLKVSIREVALGGPDTATRSKVVWQVKLKRIENNIDLATVGKQIKSDHTYFRSLLGQDLLKPGNGKLKARATKPVNASYNNSCFISFDSRYRGAENQLYRVEIFNVDTSNSNITFVWSRDNSSVVFPILTSSITNSSTLTLTLEHLGHDSRSSLSEGDWVEIVNDDYVLHELPRKLLKVDKIDRNERQVTLIGDTDYKVMEQEKHPILRRWDDYREINANFSSSNENWIPLENAIEVQFEDGCYQVGDYWLIPVRIATGDVEWPKKRIGNKLLPDAQTPHGVAHHYAPLALISVATDPVTVHDCRRSIVRQENTIPLLKEFNQVVNASWHHDQVIEINSSQSQGDSGSTPEDPVIAVNSPDLTNLLTNLGLVVEFQKPVRVDTLHQRSVFILAQPINASTGENSYMLPMEVEPVQVRKAETKSIRWLMGNEELNSEFQLITDVRPLTKNKEFTKAVRLILKNPSMQEIFPQNGSFQLVVTLRGDWIFDEEVLFDTISSNLAGDFKNSIVPDSLYQQFRDKGISLSPNAVLAKEKENLRWRLIDRDKMYVIRLNNTKLTISETHALDGNHIWPGVPLRSSGNGSEGGDWISVIHIKQP
jgi:hypothetical protein